MNMTESEIAQRLGELSGPALRKVAADVGSSLSTIYRWKNGESKIPQTRCALLTTAIDRASAEGVQA